MSEVAGAYSSLKFLHHPDRLEQLRSGKQIVPVHVQCSISGKCTHACAWCSYRWDGNISNELFHVLDPVTGEKNHNPNRYIPYEKVIEIIDDCVEMGVKALQFTGGGEPTVHPKHHELFRYALDRGLEISLVTHGGLLRPDTIETLMRASWVRVSVDSATPETHSSMRRVVPSQFHRAIENIKRLCQARDRAASSLVIGFGFVLSKENWREVVDAALLARSLGVDSFRISAVFQPDGERYYDGFYEQARDLCMEVEKLSNDRFRVVNSFGRRVEDLRQGHPDYQACSYQQFVTYIGDTQQVFRCCNTAFSTHGLIGSIEHQRFRDLWLSEEKQADFRKFDARSCERCQFHAMNKAMAYALEPEPQHASFV